MAVYLDDVAYWVAHWAETGEPVSESVARTIAAYWQNSAETGALARFALGQAVDTEAAQEALLEDVDSTIRYVRSAGATYETARVELDALKAWALDN
jgi:hypothetical protein